LSRPGWSSPPQGNSRQENANYRQRVKTRSVPKSKSTGNRWMPFALAWREAASSLRPSSAALDFWFCQHPLRAAEPQHVTLRLVWKEHRQAHPDGHGYNRFCRLCRGTVLFSSLQFSCPLNSLSHSWGALQNCPSPLWRSGHLPAALTWVEQSRVAPQP
jgi:hypothetical protein